MTIQAHADRLLDEFLDTVDCRCGDTCKECDEGEGCCGACRQELDYLDSDEARWDSQEKNW